MIISLWIVIEDSWKCRLSTASDFALLSWYTSVLNKVIALMVDVDLNGVYFDPIGDLGLFTGTFEGNGHVIRNPVINRKSLSIL